MACHVNDVFVVKWAAGYAERMPSEEVRLFAQLTPVLEAQGYFTRDQFLDVGRWKSPRSRSLLLKNSEDEVKEVTKIALGPTEERVSALRGLHGVQEAIASALLTVWRPDAYTVTDWRARDCLKHLGCLALARPTYGLYLGVCRDLSDKLNLPDDEVPALRLLDRALWKYSQTYFDTKTGRWTDDLNDS